MYTCKQLVTLEYGGKNEFRMPNSKDLHNLKVKALQNSYFFSSFITSLSPHFIHSAACPRAKNH